MGYVIGAIVVVVAMVAAYMLTPAPSLPQSSQKALSSIDVATNSNSRTIPELFGTAEIVGNIIWSGNLRSTKYEVSY